MSNPSAERRFLDLVSGASRGPIAAVSRGALSAIEPFYAAAARARNLAYDRGWKSIRHLPRPVICVGNLTTGGTGKTPVVAWVARHLAAGGRRVGVLTRGYRKRGSAESDEAELLRQELGGAATIIVGADRFAAATQALRSGAAIDVFVMDDGLQHRRLHRDLDLVMLDATNPFGHGRLLPRGLLREPPRQGLRRAGGVIVTRSDLASPEQLAAADAEVRRWIAPGAPVVRSRMGVTGVRIGAERHPADGLRGRRAFLFAGVGNPAAFERGVAGAGAQVVGRRWFGDHHAYTAADLAALRARAALLGAEFLVTTAKDAVKLTPPAEDIAVVLIDLQFDDDESRRQVEALIGRAVASARP